jgi:hypothetical protein
MIVQQLCSCCSSVQVQPPFPSFRFSCCPSPSQAILSWDECGIILACDGQPALQLQSDEHDKEKEKGNSYLPSQLVNQGFHLLLNGYKSCGINFRHSIEEDIAKLHRNSEGKLNWVFNPGDPNKSQLELWDNKLAFKCCMVIGFLEHWHHANPGRVEAVFSLTDIIDYTIE